MPIAPAAPIRAENAHEKAQRRRARHALKRSDEGGPTTAHIQAMERARERVLAAGELLVRTAPSLAPEVAARARARYALLASGFGASGEPRQEAVQGAKAVGGDLSYVRGHLDAAQAYLDAVGQHGKGSVSSGLWSVARRSLSSHKGPAGMAAGTAHRDALDDARRSVDKAGQHLARAASADNATLAAHARALYTRMAALFEPGGLVAPGTHEMAVQRAVALDLAKIHLEAAQTHLLTAKGRSVAGAAAARRRLADSQRIGRLPVHGGIGSHADAAGQDETHRRALEGTRHRLVAADEYLRLSPQLDTQLTARAQALFSQLSALHGAIHGNSHQGSLALARNHLQAAGAHFGPVERAEGRTFSRAHAYRAALARDAQAGASGHPGDAAGALAERDLARLLGQPARVQSASGTACEHNCLSLESAAVEMKVVAARNARVKDPVYHVVLSWPSGESPTDDQAFACGRHALQAVGMQDHQYVFAVHRDTAHVHLHIAVNRVNPDTFAAVYPDRDYFKLDRAMRELELQHGWQHDKGPYAVFERGGQRVIDWASKAPDSKEKLPTRAADMERHAGAESLFTYARGEPKAAVLKLLGGPKPSWDTLHATLARFALELRPKGQGLAVYDLSGESRAPIKASDMHESLSLPRLTKKLGAYKEPAKQLLLAEQRYDRFREPVRDPALREQRRQERADARRGLRERYEQYRASFALRRLDEATVKQRFEELRATARRRRAEVRDTVRDPGMRRAMYSVIAFETLRARQRLLKTIKQERDALRRDPANRRMSFREWVTDQAARGDAAAISQLRGWAYAEQRERRQLAALTAAEHVDGFRGAEVVDPVARELGNGFSFVVKRNGSVSYRSSAGQEVFVDHGQRIEVLPAALAHSQALAAAHALAVQKYGPGVETTGQAGFRNAVAGLGTTRPPAPTPTANPETMPAPVAVADTATADTAARVGAVKPQPAPTRRRRQR